MPELPEVETTRRGLEPHIVGQKITHTEIREPRLRWPISEEIYNLTGKTILSLRRRAKYLLFDFDKGCIISHLGMSGSMRIVHPETDWKKHDHVAIRLRNGLELRYHDPRRFGCLLWSNNPEQHPLINKLGPEPLSNEFDTDYLFNKSKSREVSIKQHIMNAAIVVGVGNIYASEALFMAGISPTKSAASVSRKKQEQLVASIKEVLQRSIDQGGTTLRDFLDPNGTAGYFKQQLRVYDREGEACRICKTPIQKITLGQRSTFYCPKCQR